MPRHRRTNEERLLEHAMAERTLRRKVALEKNPPMRVVQAAIATLERARGQSTQHSRQQYPAFWVRIDAAARILALGMDSLCDPVQPAPPHPDSRVEPVRDDTPAEPLPRAGHPNAAFGGEA